MPGAHLSDRLEARRLEIPKILRGNAEAAANILTAEIKRTLSVPGTRDNPAPPGSAPHKVDGDLVAASKAVARDGVVVVLTSQVGVWQDKGTTKTPARPWVQPSISACWSKLRPAFLTLRKR